MNGIGVSCGVSPSLNSASTGPAFASLVLPSNFANSFPTMLLPLIISIPIFFVQEATQFLVPIYAFYHIGHASHLFLDLKPKEWKGSALVHIFWVNEEGRKTMSPKVSRMFLLVNGVIILAAGIILMYFFQRWI